MTAELRQGFAVLVATIVDDDLRARRQRLAERRARAKFWAAVEAKRAGCRLGWVAKPMTPGAEPAAQSCAEPHDVR